MMNTASNSKQNPFGAGLDSLKRTKATGEEKTEVQDGEKVDGKSDDGSSPPPAKKKSNFCFRPSQLGKVADELWEHNKSEGLASKKGFTNHHNCLVLDTETSHSKGSSTSPNPSSAGETIEQKKTSFIFGQNIEKKVASASEKVQNGSAETAKEDGFKDLAEKVPESSPIKEEAAPSTSDEAKSKLAESAASFEKQVSDQSTLIGSEVEIFTGEEGETNLIQAKCKLHVFDIESKSWHERGQGNIRINEKPPEGTQQRETRLVMRVQGSLRVALNSKIWSDMLLERVGPKKLKISAMDPETKTVLLYLITTSQPDSERIESLLKNRIRKLKQSTEKQKEDSD